MTPRVLNLLVAGVGGVWLAGLVPGHGQSLPILYSETVDQPVGYPKARPTSRPGTDVTDAITDPYESNCLEAEGCFGYVPALPPFPVVITSPGYVVRETMPGIFEFIGGGNMPSQITFLFSFPDGAVNQLIRDTPGFATLTVVAARDIDEGAAESETLDVSAEGVPLGNMGTFASANPCPRPPHIIIANPDYDPTNPTSKKTIVLDETCGPNYHTDVPGTGSLMFSHETMSQILATPGPAEVGVNIAPQGGVSRLKIFSVTLTYTAPEPSTFVLVALGLIGIVLSQGMRKA